jgi:signal transduction histidine kinase/ligand-binding sensor domain-containing protein
VPSTGAAPTGTATLGVGGNVSPIPSHGTPRKQYPFTTTIRLAIALVLVGLFSRALLCAQVIEPSTAITPSYETGSAKAPPLRVVEANNLRFTRLSTSQGLSQTRVHNIVEDGQGFMWFGTQYGLDRYDGYTFKLFLHDSHQENSLGCVSIRALFRDQSGTIWVGCDRSVDRYDAATQTFRHYPLNGTPFSISQDHLGAMWISTNNGLYRLDPATSQIKHYGHDPADPHSLSSNDIKMTGEDHETRFWVSDGGKIEEFDRKNATVLHTIDVPSTARSAVMFYIDHSGVFWVMYTLTGQESGLAVLNRSKNEIIRYPIYEDSGKAITVGIHTAVEDADNTLWLATNGSGLLKLDRTNWTVVRYRNHLGDLESLADDRVIALCADREGNVWEGLHAMEPNFFHSTNTGFAPLLREHDNPQGLGESFINAIYEDYKKTLWIGTTGALVRVDPKSGQHTYYPLPGRSGDDDVIAITEDHAGNLWMGTTGAGLNRFDRKTGKYTTYRHDPNNPFSISSDVVSRIAVAPDETLWLSTWDGLDHFDPQTGRFLVYRYHPGRAEHLFNVTVAPDKTLWMGGFSGLYHFDPATEHFTVYSHNPKDSNSLSDNVVNSVLLDHTGAIWATTENGLNRLDSLQGIFRTYYAKDGLASNALSCLLEDQSGSLWMSSNRGISAFSPSTGRFQNYSAADGIPGVDLTGWDACFKDANGRMYFGGFGGGVSFDPNKELGRLETLPIVLTDLQVSDKSVQIGPRSILKQAIDHTTAITLTHAQDRFSITFAALGFWNSAAIRYRFRLEGLDKDWIEARSDRRTVSYTTLPSGKYTFRAQAQIRPNEWTEPGMVLSVTILPPWWATLWFRTLCVLLAASMFWMFHIFKLRQASAEIHARAEERLYERERIARELHDTLLQGVQALILHFHAAAKQIPSSQPARKMIDDTLERADEILIEGRNRVKDLRASSEEAKDLPEAFREAMEDLAQMQPGKLHVIVGGNPRTLNPRVRDEVFWIGREALLNSFRHAEAKRIEIEIDYSHQGLRLRFRDDGRGIDPRILESGRKADHWGLRGMRERAERVDGTLEIWSRPDTGTEVDLKIPATTAYEDHFTQHSGRDRGIKSSK